MCMVVQILLGKMESFRTIMAYCFTPDTLDFFLKHNECRTKVVTKNKNRRRMYIHIHMQLP